MKQLVLILLWAFSASITRGEDRIRPVITEHLPPLNDDVAILYSFEGWHSSIHFTYSRIAHYRDKELNREEARERISEEMMSCLNRLDLLIIEHDGTV